MNILTIIVLTVFALCVYIGYKKGFVKTAFSLVAWILVFVLCDHVTPIVTNCLIQYTDIEVVIEEAIEEKVTEGLLQTMGNSGLSYLETSIPEELKELLLGDHESVQDALLGEQIWDWTPVVEGIVNTIGFILTIILLRLVTGIIEHMLESISDMPVIGRLDTMLGVACGGAKGLIWCWVILAVVSVMAVTGTNTELATYIAQSKLLTWLQDNNILLNIIASFI